MTPVPPPLTKGLTLRGLEAQLGRRKLLSGITFTAPAGAVTGLIGPNGAGKSTLLTALPGGLAPQFVVSGTAELAGQSLASLPPRARARLVALVEQGAGTETRLSVRDVVALGRIPHQPLWQSQESPADLQAIAAALHLTGLTRRAGDAYASLSGGARQRVQLARALAQEPELLLLDEPTSHLDIRAQLLMMQLLRDWARTGGTVLAALHDLGLAARFCDHLVVLAGGRIIAEGAPARVLTPALLRAVYGVDALISGTDPLCLQIQTPSDMAAGRKFIDKPPDAKSDFT